MTARRIFTGILIALICLLVWGIWWTTGWKERRQVDASGGLYFPGRLELYVPQFFQADSRWGDDELGPTPGKLAAEGCAVASAAMTLASYGVDVDPGRLNKFLTALRDGYTPEGWLYWEKAAEFDNGFTSRLLPHYEDLPSYYLIDRNLLDRNPVIARLRYRNGITHFVVICGKEGFDYLIRDPGRGGEKGVYPLKEFGSAIEAIRFYRNPSARP
jgi:hypothetical protein